MEPINLSDLGDLTWLENSACKNVPDPDIFFPPRDKALYKGIADEAKSYCFGNGETTSACPVRKECLWYAVASDMEHGIFGGMSHRERNALVRKWQRQYKDSMTLKEYIFQLNKKEK